MATVRIIEKRDGKLGKGWYATVEVGGERYYVGIETSGRVRIPFKPRGTYGWTYRGFVRDAAGKSLYAAKVTGSTGVRWLLEAAGVVALRPSEQRKAERRAAFDAMLAEIDARHRQR